MVRSSSFEGKITTASSNIADASKILKKSETAAVVRTQAGGGTATNVEREMSVSPGKLHLHGVRNIATSKNIKFAQSPMTTLLDTLADVNSTTKVIPNGIRGSKFGGARRSHPAKAKSLRAAMRGS